MKLLSSKTEWSEKVDTCSKNRMNWKTLRFVNKPIRPNKANIVAWLSSDSPTYPRDAYTTSCVVGLVRVAMPPWLFLGIHGSYLLSDFQMPTGKHIFHDIPTVKSQGLSQVYLELQRWTSKMIYRRFRNPGAPVAPRCHIKLEIQSSS